jgi:manganese-dependent ADP-ribose/CDP-alcohol diphosphatase
MPSLTRRAFLETTALAGAGTLFCGRLLGAEGALRFGLVADAQYADAPARGVRHYRKSLEKLTVAVAAFNQEELDFVIHLGDLIDHGFKSFADILPIYRKLKAPGYLALGNHDFAVAESEKAMVSKTMGMEARYYDFKARGWRFAVLDGNEIGYIATAKGSPERVQAEKMLAAMKAKKLRNAMGWNGALSETQLAWLDKVLADADAKGQPAIVFCHFPVFPANAHNLWNDTQVIAMLERHRSVVAYINGHNHAGNYGAKAGIHYLTVNGMVDTPDTNAYGVATQLAAAGVGVVGSGRLKPRRLVRG